MEIRTLRYFLAVAREENMTRAAETLHVTQPTLSKALKALEDELGKKLYTRHSFSIKLTDEGILLRNRAEDLVSMADKIEREFITLDDITAGDLYFGLAESYQISYLAREIHAFKQNYPGLRYHITSGDTEQVVEKLDKGLLDFVVLAEAPDTAKYESLLFPESDTWGLVMPEDHPLAQKEAIRVVLQRLHFHKGASGISPDFRQADQHFSRKRVGVPRALSPDGNEAVYRLEEVPDLLSHCGAVPCAAEKFVHRDRRVTLRSRRFYVPGIRIQLGT